MDLHFHWIVRHDMPAVLDIERDSYAFPWSEAEFLDALLERGRVGIVAKSDRSVVGFLLYNSRPRSLEIVNLAVAADLRRRGIGSRLVDFLKEKLSSGGRDELTVCVSDDSLGAQLFLRSQKFRATAVLRDYFDEHEGDAYLMRYRLDCRVPTPRRHNRLSRYFDMEV